MGRTISVACLALLITLGAVASADAGRKHRAKAKLKHSGSEIALESVGPDAATGIVSTPRPGCLGERVVTLYRQESWTTVPTSSVFARTHTRSDGSWTVRGPLYTGQYYAVVEMKRSARLVCWPATSDWKVF